MTTTVTATTFKDRFTVFSSVADATVTAAITEADRWTNDAAYGTDRHDDAIRYLAAHLLALDAQANAAASAAASAGAGPSGPVSSKAGLSASISYAVPSGAGDDWFASTVWGQRFLSIERRVFASRIL